MSPPQFESPSGGRWTHLPRHTPAQCSHCGLAGPTILREYPNGRKGAYHHECAVGLWGLGWPDRVRYDPFLIGR